MQHQAPKVIPWRFALVLAVVTILSVAAWWLTTRGLGAFPTRCILHHTTGIHCPGCGMTRATHALLTEDILTAFSYNPLGVILLPIALIGLALETIGWIRNTTPPYRLPLGKKGAKVIAISVITFTILRNLPWSPFSWLAP
jgi:hypothetical protein